MDPLTHKLDQTISPLLGGGGLAGVIGHFSDLSYWRATTKTYVYLGMFGFFRIQKKKNYPTMVQSHFKKYNGKSIFLSAIFSDKTLQKKLE